MDLRPVHGGRFWRTLVHPRLRTKLIMGVVAAACAALAVQFAVAGHRVDANLSQLEAQRLEEYVDVSQNALDQARVQLETRASGASVSPQMAAAVARRDGAWIHRNVTSWLATNSGIQSVTVLDALGRPVDVVGRPLPDLADEPTLRSAVGKVVSSQYVVRDGELWILAVAPVARHDFVEPYQGAVVLGQRVDDELAQVLERLTTAQATVLLDGEVVAASDETLAEALLAASGGSVMHGGDEPLVAAGYASQARPLLVSGHSAQLVVSTARGPITVAQRSLQRAMLISLLPAVLLAAFIAVILSVQLGRPLRALREAVNAIAFGDLGRRVKVHGDDEIADLGRAFNAMADRVTEAQNTLRRAAVRDSLTGLLNHREFYNRLYEETARTGREQAAVALLMIDLDYFKEVNDRHGHLVGDAVLRAAAKVISESVRDGDVVARYAGDEFAVILPGADERAAVTVAQRICESAAACGPEAGLPETEPVTLSVGVAVRAVGGVSATQLAQAADEALYCAKEKGRDRVEVAGRDLGDPVISI